VDPDTEGQKLVDPDPDSDPEHCLKVEEQVLIVGLHVPAQQALELFRFPVVCVETKFVPCVIFSR
jgi:hypothetical protein